MAYADLTNEEQRTLQGWLNQQLRRWAGQQARLNNRAAAVNTVYNGQITQILAQLAGADVIPDRTDLDGATSLTKDELINLVSYIQSVVGPDGGGGINTEPHRQLYAKATGGVNITE